MKLNHPAFKKTAAQDTLQTNDPRQQVHTVKPPDEADFMKEMSKVVQNLPSKKVPEAPTSPIISDEIVKKEVEKKSVLEKLILFKQPHYKEVEIAGVNFRLKLLNAEENAKVYSMIRELPQEDQLTKSAIVMLAGSLVDAGGVKIEDSYEGEPIDDPMVKRYHELCSWNMPIVNALIAAFKVFTDEVEGGYTKSFLAK